MSSRAKEIFKKIGLVPPKFNKDCHHSGPPPKHKRKRSCSLSSLTPSEIEVLVGNEDTNLQSPSRDSHLLPQPVLSAEPTLPSDTNLQSPSRDSHLLPQPVLSAEPTLPSGSNVQSPCLIIVPPDDHILGENSVTVTPELHAPTSSAHLGETPSAGGPVQSSTPLRGGNQSGAFASSLFQSPEELFNGSDFPVGGWLSPILTNGSPPLVSLPEPSPDNSTQGQASISILDISGVGVLPDEEASIAVDTVQEPRVTEDDIDAILNEFVVRDGAANSDGDGAANSDGDGIGEIERELTRRRLIHTYAWKVNQIKMAVNSGLEHTNAKGKFIPAVQIKPPCVCKKGCFRRISQEQRLEVFRKFWSLDKRERKWDFITRHSIRTPTAHKTTQEASRRKFSLKYFFLIGPDKTKVDVCQAMFLNTLSVGTSTVESAHGHVDNNTGTLSPDKRGRHSNRPNKMTEEQVESALKHIDSYPRVPPHYVRASSKREYVEWGLSIPKMFKHYLTWTAEEDIPASAKATKWMYREVFCTRRNIGFFKPKKDQCSLCNVIKHGTKVEKALYQEQWIQHIKDKVAARKEKERAKKYGVERRDEVTVCVFDLQKVLPCPKGENSLLYYKNKLSVFNFTVFDMIEYKGVCYLWHEGIAKRGANEVGSCLLDFFASCAQRGIREILSFSDNCGGQNKNRFIYAMFMLAAARHNLKIRHTFLETGHTQNEGDSVHGRIEISTEGKEIWTFQEWVQYIEDAKENDPPYEVRFLRNPDVYDLHDIVTKQSWDKDENGNTIAWNKLRIVEADCESPQVLSLWYEFGGAAITMRTDRRRGASINPITYTLKRAYDARIPLKKNTIDGLQYLCTKLAIPSKYHEFYHDVINNAVGVDDDVNVVMEQQVLEDGIDNDRIHPDDPSSNHERENNGQEDEESN